MTSTTHSNAGNVFAQSEVDAAIGDGRDDLDVIQARGAMTGLIAFQQDVLQNCLPLGIAPLVSRAELEVFDLLVADLRVGGADR